MSYEQFRSTFSARLLAHLPQEMMRSVLEDLDFVSHDYKIEKASTDLITADGFPEIIKIYCAALAVENKAAGTIKGYMTELKKMFAFIGKHFTQITTNDIRYYMYHRQQTDHLKKSSLEHVRVIVNAFFAWCVDEEYMDRNPAKKIEKIKYPRDGREAIPRLEIEYIRQACETPREKALIDFLYSTGCRVSECAAVEYGDIDWTERSVKVRHGKGDKFRIVYFNAEAEVSLRNYVESKTHSTNVLFSNLRPPYSHVTKEALEMQVRKICSRLKNLSVEVCPHALRTTFATHASGSGMPVEHIQKLLGHSNINTTMRYVKVSQEEAKASHRKFIA